MKNLILLFSLSIFLFSITTTAQPRITPQERLKVLKERLNLIEDQSQTIEKILIKSDEEIKKLRSSDNSDREQFREQMEKTNNEIEKVLDEKQKEEFKKILDERKNHRPGRMKH
jgi:Spy/CpxP family protein refolding chaperone